MKMKIKNRLSLLNYISTTPKFKLLFIMLFFIAFYGSNVSGTSVKNIIDSILVTIQFPIFNMIFLLLILLNTYNTCSTISKKFSFYIIRLKSKKAYYIEMMKISLIMNLFYLILFLIIYAAFKVFFSPGYFSIDNYNNYNINNLMYLLFYFVRYILYIFLVTNIMTMLFVSTKNIFILIIDLIMSGMYLIVPIDGEIKNNFTLNFWKYFNGLSYDSFNTELKYSLIYLILLIVINIFLYNIIKKRKGINIS